MRQLFRLPFPALAAPGLVLAWIALGPGTAAASCGSYVTIQGRADVGGPTQLPVGPCHGPGCSKAPATPVFPLTAPVTSSTDSDQPSVPAESTGGLTAGPGWRRLRPVDCRPVQVASSIFHPPRTS